MDLVAHDLPGPNCRVANNRVGIKIYLRWIHFLIHVQTVGEVRLPQASSGANSDFQLMTTGVHSRSPGACSGSKRQNNTCAAVTHTRKYGVLHCIEHRLCYVGGLEVNCAWWVRTPELTEHKPLDEASIDREGKAVIHDVFSIIVCYGSLLGTCCRVATLA